MKPYLPLLLILPACVNLSKPWESWDAGSGPVDYVAWRIEVPASGGAVADGGGVWDGGMDGGDASLSGSDLGGLVSLDTRGELDGATEEDAPIAFDTGFDSKAPDTAQPDLIRSDIQPRDTWVPPPPDVSTDLSGDSMLPVLPDAQLFDLLVHYPLDSILEGSKVMDSSGNNRVATVSGPYSFVQGRVGQAIAFAGATDGGTGGGYLVLPPDLFTKAREISVAMWFACNSKTPWQRLLEVSSGDANAFAITPFSAPAPSTLRVEISAGGDAKQFLDGPEIRPDGAWHHLVVVMDAASVRIYLDGVLSKESTTITKRPADMGNTTNNFVGRSRNTWDPYFDGKIDELRIYGRALTADEIKALSTN